MLQRLFGLFAKLACIGAGVFYLAAVMRADACSARAASPATMLP